MGFTPQVLQHIVKSLVTKCMYTSNVSPVRHTFQKYGGRGAFWYPTMKLMSLLELSATAATPTSLHTTSAASEQTTIDSGYDFVNEDPDMMYFKTLLCADRLNMLSVFRDLRSVLQCPCLRCSYTVSVIIHTARLSTGRYCSVFHLH